MDKTIDEILRNLYNLDLSYLPWRVLCFMVIERSRRCRTCCRIHPGLLYMDCDTTIQPVYA